MKHHTLIRSLVALCLIPCFASAIDHTERRLLSPRTEPHSFVSAIVAARALESKSVTPSASDYAHCPAGANKLPKTTTSSCVTNAKANKNLCPMKSLFDIEGFCCLMCMPGIDGGGKSGGESSRRLSGSESDGGGKGKGKGGLNGAGPAFGAVSVCVALFVIAALTVFRGDLVKDLANFINDWDDKYGVPDDPPEAPSMLLKVCCPFYAVMKWQGFADKGDLWRACCFGAFFTVTKWEPKEGKGISVSDVKAGFATAKADYGAAEAEAHMSSGQLEAQAEQAGLGYAENKALNTKAGKAYTQAKENYTRAKGVQGIVMGVVSDVLKLLYLFSSGAGTEVTAACSPFTVGFSGDAVCCGPLLLHYLKVAVGVIHITVEVLVPLYCMWKMKQTSKPYYIPLSKSNHFFRIVTGTACHATLPDPNKIAFHTKLAVGGMMITRVANMGFVLVDMTIAMSASTCTGAFGNAFRALWSGAASLVLDIPLILMLMQFGFFFFFDGILQFCFVWSRLCKCCAVFCRWADRGVPLFSLEVLSTRRRGDATSAAKLESWVFRGYQYTYFLTNSTDTKTIIVRGLQFMKACGNFEKAFGDVKGNKHRFPGETPAMWGAARINEGGQVEAAGSEEETYGQLAQS